MSENIRRWRGLTALIADMVANGASAVERVHIATASRPFAILRQIPVVSAPASVIEAIHHASVAGVYASVRAVTRVVETAVDLALEAADDDDQPSSPG